MLRRLYRTSLEYVHLFGMLFYILCQLIYGLWKVSKITKPRITVFGGARIKLEDPFAATARELAKKLVEHHISVITGGGPGIMEAVNCGARDASVTDEHIHSMGIGVKDLPGEEGINTCAQTYIMLKYFFARKWLLINYSEGFVVFPGGFGTLDELAEVLTLIKTQKLPRVPIILFCSEYWQPLLDWMKKFLLAHEAISEEDYALLTVTDDIGQAFEVLRKHCELCKKRL